METLPTNIKELHSIINALILRNQESEVIHASSVNSFVLEIQELKARILELENQKMTNSSNSSKPLSTDYQILSPQIAYKLGAE